MAQENDPDEQERRKREEQRRRRERQRKDEERNDRTDDALEVVDAGAAAGSGCARVAGCGRGRGGRADADGGCDGPCDFTLMRLSVLLLVAAVIVPERPVARKAVRGLVQGYRRWLTRFTPACPSTPSCSAYALSAVDTMGVRRGLVAAAHRIRRCGTG